MTGENLVPNLEATALSNRAVEQDGVEPVDHRDQTDELCTPPPRVLLAYSARLVPAPAVPMTFALTLATGVSA